MKDIQTQSESIIILMHVNNVSAIIVNPLPITTIAKYFFISQILGGFLGIPFGIWMFIYGLSDLLDSHFIIIRSNNLNVTINREGEE